ncbi:MAG TPA: hypothetical protein VHY79_19840 [Rhizomicrobium sp.]|jgi:hypothetical protein|nr:hypothetical protein [Rhizomicrobium sp.]
MRALRFLFTGWAAVFSLLVSPTLAVLLSPQDGDERRRWLFVAPWLVAYVWLTWPKRPDQAD